MRWAGLKECRDTDFLVERNMQRDIYVPYNAIQDITGDRIALNIPAGRVDKMGWVSPPIVGRRPGGRL